MRLLTQRVLLSAIIMMLAALWACGGGGGSGSANGSTSENPPGETTSSNGTLAGNDAVCECGDRVCGVDACGNPCGTCASEEAFCFSGTCQTEDVCPSVAIEMVEQSAYRMDDKGTERLKFEATVTGSQFTSVEIVSNREIAEVGSLGSGTYELVVDNLTNCDEVCVVAHMDCAKQECAFPYIVSRGTLELTSAGEAATRLVGTASELVLTQAYYDSKTRQYQILKKAESKCMDGFDFDAPLEQIVIEPTDCTPDGTGIQLGDEIADFTVTNCEGDEVNLHDNCGAEALWLIAAADW